MSAFIVSKEHIDYLVAGAQMGKRSMGTMRWSWPDGPIAGQTQSFEIAGAEYAGQMLWDENIKSVHARIISRIISAIPANVDSTHMRGTQGPHAWTPWRI